MDASRAAKLMTLGEDPPNDLATIIDDLFLELQRRGVGEEQIKGVEIALKIAFALGEKNAALKIAREVAQSVALTTESRHNVLRESLDCEYIALEAIPSRNKQLRQRREFARRGSLCDAARFESAGFFRGDDLGWLVVAGKRWALISADCPLPAGWRPPPSPSPLCGLRWAASTAIERMRSAGMGVAGGATERYASSRSIRCASCAWS